MFTKWLRTKPTETQQAVAPPVYQPERAAIDVPGGIVFDEEDLLRRLMGDRDLVGLVVGGFLKDAPLQLDNLSNRLNAADAPGVRAQSHAFKGAAGTVAAERLLDRLADRDLSTTRVQLPVRLLERGSGELRPLVRS